MRAALLALLLSLVPLAGCLGTEEVEPIAPAATPTPPTSTTASDAKSAEASPNAEPTSTGTTAAEGETSAPPPTPFVTPVTWDGKLAASVCVPAGLNSCVGPPPVTESDSWLDVKTPGLPTGGSVTLTWTPASPLTEKLVLFAARASSCGSGCVESAGGVAVEGVSPLTLEIDGSGFVEGEFLALFVHVPRQTPSPVYAQAHGDQTFHLEGSVTSLR